MNKSVIVIGTGIGGLSAAIRLAQQGFSVTLLEARSQTGGLASGVKLENFSFDAGPYILLDKPGLNWAFNQLDINIDKTLTLSAIPHIYEVQQQNGPAICFDADIKTTASQFEKHQTGSGQLYKDFVRHTYKVYESLQPLTFKSHPRPIDLLLNGSIIHAPFMLRSLSSVLHRSHLPDAIQKSIAIWTYVAGQPLDKAPSPMAFVPALFHNVGAYYIKGGMQSVAKVLTEKAISCGVQIVYNTRVKTICTKNKSVTGVKTEAGEFFPTTTVISNAAGVGTYTQLVEAFDTHEKKKLEQLPLQSPGICIYLAVKGKRPPYYIRFKQTGKDCIAFVQPGIMEPELEQDGWYPARLIAPVSHTEATDLGAEGQLKLMENLLQDNWWQQGISDYKVLHRRTTFEWGKEYNLYRDSMNPVMTAAFMRQGRLRHRSPFIKGLYLTGSATHPGQWVSFCAVSGVLAADCVVEGIDNG